MKFGARLFGVAVVSMTLGVAGCGGDTAPADKTAPSSNGRSASAPLVKLTTANFLPVAKKAMAGKTTVRTSMRMLVAGQTITTSGVARFGDRPAMSMVMTSPGSSGTSKVILVGDVLYVSIPGQVPEGKFVKTPADGSSPLAKSLRQSLDQADPKKTFTTFEAGLRKVTYAGTETANGLKLQHYKVSVDTKAVLAAQGQPMVAGLPKTITYDIWLDNARLMRKVTFKMAGVSAVMTANDYGKPVSIKAPPADDIVTR